MKLAINVGFIAAVAILILVGMISLGSVKRLIAGEQWVAHTYEVRDALLSLMNDLNEASAGRRAYVTTGDLHFLDAHLKLKRTATARIAALRKLTKDNARQGPRLDMAAGLIGAQIDAQAKSIAYRHAHPADLATQTALTVQGTRINEELKTLFTKMAAEEADLLRARLIERNHRIAGAVFAEILGVALSILLLSGVILMLRKEVHKRASAEAELTVKSGTLQSILASMADGVIVADKDGKFLHFSPAAERMTGVPALDVSPAAWASAYEVFQADGVTPYPPDELPLVRAMRGETVEHAELCLRHGVAQTGAGVWVDIVASPLLDGDGSHIGGVVVMRDNTERRQAREEIERLNHELQGNVVALQAVNKELETFSYSVSHDLRSPLRSIDGFSQALAEDYAHLLDEQGLDFLDRIRAATQRMGRLIDDMLSLSRITRAEMAHEEVDLSKMARSIVEELRAGDPDRDVAVEITDGISASGDPTLLWAALGNLIGNAWKFTSKEPKARIEVGAIDGPGGAPTCFVRDNGAGFDPAYQHKLFGTFQRLHAMEEFAGTGIGLASVQRVIARHGGRVWGESEVGKGATFFFTIPPDRRRDRRSESEPIPQDRAA